MFVENGATEETHTITQKKNERMRVRTRTHNTFSLQPSTILPAFHPNRNLKRKMHTDAQNKCAFNGNRVIQVVCVVLYYTYICCVRVCVR